MIYENFKENIKINNKTWTQVLRRFRPACGVSEIRNGEIRNGEDLWQWSRLEISLNAFLRSTVPQNNSSSPSLHFQAVNISYFPWEQ